MVPDSQLIMDSPKDFANFINERNKQVIKEAQNAAKKIAKTEMALLKFELLYSITVSKKEREKTAKMFREHRETKWKECLKKSNGDEQKAFAIYCDF